MPFTIKTRYGSLERRGDDVDIEAVVEDLVYELETEQFDEPDDEHTQIAVCFGDWGVTVFVSGLIALDDLTGTVVPFNSHYLRARDRGRWYVCSAKWLAGRSIRSEPLIGGRLRNLSRIRRISSADA